MKTTPRLSLSWHSRASVVCSLLLMAGASPFGRANPITIQLTVDELRHGTAVLSGNLSESPFPDLTDDSFKFTWVGGYYQMAVLPFEKIGTNWKVWGNLTYEYYFDNNNTFLKSTYDLSAFGQHLTAPDKGEAVPGFRMLTYYDNLSGTAGTSDRNPAYQLFDWVPHLAGQHHDLMTLAVSDLNGDAAGVIPFSGNFGATIQLDHVPEGGSSLLLLGAAIVGLLAAGRVYRRWPA